MFGLKLLFIYLSRKNVPSLRVTFMCVRVFFTFVDAILNMVNNIAANVLGGAPELEGGIETGGTHPSHTSHFLFT